MNNTLDLSKMSTTSKTNGVNMLIRQTPKELSLKLSAWARLRGISRDQLIIAELESAVEFRGPRLPGDDSPSRDSTE